MTLTDVAVSRGAGPVISGVDAHVSSGEVLAVVGPNGAGKTSLIEAISGVIKTSAGDIRLDGDSITKLSRVQRARRGIIHVEQGRAVFPSLTVAENVRLTAGSADGVVAALEYFPELQKRFTAPAGLLSGGEQQMVVLARSFAARPRVLLIDEMSLGLAPVVVQRLLPAVTEFAAQGAAVILVEQFTQLALGIAEQALVVASGAVRYSGSAEVLAADPDLLHRAYLGESSVVS
nr:MULTISPECIES: ATP-binding cassette domain-containing protein [Microbacterium]